eukprot:CAMPEP_0194202422 /NCGR_PEP_ID=MMETSP0156-20130528/2446_1 /TAXON_ID=33649 /ORGANISM="Thalassionema nitzschioides, Strain L26-B" /LENGTH=250 /DNA_ID=CAMNT_0038927907 /DNA_START=264 /DNA_END=1016 /DNA_ORIENTATION=-
MADDSFRPVGSQNKRRHRRGAPASEDDNGSLTYSAGSSCSSAAGESTDSSFADIMKVLAFQDEPELEALMKREGIDARTLAKAKAKATDLSVASSLNYSTDGESALNGEHVLQTITGQPSDSHGPDGGGIGLRSEKILFAPADPVDRKHRKLPKSKSRGNRSSKTRALPRNNTSLQSDKKNDDILEEYTSDENNNSTQTIIPPTPGTPPPAPRPETRPVAEVKDDDSLCYAKWWMCGFADALHDLVPTSR